MKQKNWVLITIITLLVLAGIYLAYQKFSVQGNVIVDEETSLWDKVKSLFTKEKESSSFKEVEEQKEGDPCEIRELIDAGSGYCKTKLVRSWPGELVKTKSGFDCVMISYEYRESLGVCGDPWDYSDPCRICDDLCNEINAPELTDCNSTKYPGEPRPGYCVEGVCTVH